MTKREISKLIKRFHPNVHAHLRREGKLLQFIENLRNLNNNDTDTIHFIIKEEERIGPKGILNYTLINAGFEWQKSLEGHPYWASVHMRYLKKYHNITI